MRERLVIFGAGTIARLAAWHFRQDDKYDLRGFCVDDASYQKQTAHNLPVIRFSQLTRLYPPESCQIFIGLGYQKLNSIRAAACKRFTELGYQLASCISHRAVLLTDSAPGPNSFIMAGAIIEPFTEIGSNCICWAGSIVAHESRIGDNCFLSAGSVVGGMTHIGRNTFLGLNSTVQNGLRIGESCLVGAGCVVREDLSPDSMLSAPVPLKSGVRASQAARFIDL